MSLILRNTNKKLFRDISLVIGLILSFVSMKEKNWLYIVLNIVKYGATLLLGYFGGNAIV